MVVLCGNGVMSEGYYILAKSLASSSGWFCFTVDSNFPETPGVTPSTNNSSGFNAFPVGARVGAEQSSFIKRGEQAYFWTTTNDDGYRKFVSIRYANANTDVTSANKNYGMSIRFVKD